MVWWSIVWNLRCCQVPADDATVHADLACDALNAVTGRALGADLVPACTPTTPPHRPILLRLTRRRHRCRWCWSICQMVRLLNENVLDAPSTASQDLVHGGAGVGGQVKAIGHLNGIGRALLATFGVRTGSIAHDDLDARVSAQPIGEDLSIAIIESMGMCVSRSINSVPYRRCLRRRATSSTPSTRGPRSLWSSVIECRIRKSVSGLIGTPALCARRAPPSPPACRANGGQQFAGVVGPAGARSQPAVEALPSRSTTTRTMHQPSDSAPAAAAIPLSLDGHASAIGLRPEGARPRLHQNPGGLTFQSDATAARQGYSGRVRGSPKCAKRLRSANHVTVDTRSSRSVSTIMA
jgi:hypothetical protein